MGETVQKIVVVFKQIIFRFLSHKSIIGGARLNPTKYHRQDGFSLNPPFSLSLSFPLKVSIFTFTFTGWTR